VWITKKKVIIIFTRHHVATTAKIGLRAHGRTVIARVAGVHHVSSLRAYGIRYVHKILCIHVSRDCRVAAARQQQRRTTPSAGALDASRRRISLATRLLFIRRLSVDADVIVLHDHPPRGIALVAPFPLSDITVFSCQFALLSVLKISTTIAVDRVQLHELSKSTPRFSRWKRSSFLETTTVRLVEMQFSLFFLYFFPYRQVGSMKEYRPTPRV